MFSLLFGILIAGHCAEGALRPEWSSENDTGGRDTAGGSGMEKGGASPCCVPAQFEGYMGIALGFTTSSHYSDLELIQEQISFDYTTKRVATNLTANFVKHPHTLQIHYLENYITHETMIVKNGTCTKTENDGVMTHCIPDNATSYPPQVFGVGKQSIIVDSWGWYDSKRKAQNTASAFRESCIPFGFTLINTADPNLQYQLTGSYYNLTKGIRDSSVFDVPPECKDVKHTLRKELPEHVQGLLSMHQLHGN